MKNARLFLSLPFFLILLEVSSLATIYKWVEDNGTVTYRDTPPPAGKQSTVVELKDITLEHGKPFSPSDLLDSAKEKVTETARAIGTQAESLRMQGMPPENPEEYEKRLGLR